MKDYKLLISVILVSIIFGTTYLAIRVAVETIPAWFVAGLRQFIAGALLLLFLLFKKEWRWIGWKNLFIQLTLSTLMIIIANGLTTVAEKTLTSSLASLISSTSPILVFLGSMLIGLQKFRLRGLLGVLICFSDILFIFWDGLKDFANPEYRNGIIMMFIAVSGWASGTIFTKKMNIKPDNITLSLCYQFLFAGVVQIGIAYLFKENSNFNDWSLISLGALLYLSVFGSIIAFYAYLYALDKLTAVKVSILSYVNTVIAIFLGWLILNEPISFKFIIATCLIILGVFITNYNSNKSKAIPSNKLK